jgi:hypothetical protein
MLMLGMPGEEQPLRDWQGPKCWPALGLALHAFCDGTSDVPPEELEAATAMAQVSATSCLKPV